MSLEPTDAEVDAMNAHIDAIRTQLRGFDPVLSLAALNVVVAELVAVGLSAGDRAPMLGNFESTLRANVRQIASTAGVAKVH